MRALFKDLRFALRMLAKSPGTTLVAIFTLALAIAVNTSIFSAVRTLVLRPLPFPAPEQLLMVLETQPDVATMAVPYPNYRDYRAENTTLTALAALGVHTMTATGKGAPHQMLVEGYSHDMLPTLGVEPALGRNFLPEEDAPHGPRSVILKHGYWARQYGFDPAVIGQKITLDGSDWTIVGVAPAEFPSLFPCDLLIPLGARAGEDSFRDRAARPEIYLIGRMKPDVTLAEARADLEAVGAGLAARYPKEYGNTRPYVASLADEMAKDYRSEMLLMMAAVTCVLLIAAANVANLMLARAMTRQKEMQIRAALGSGRWRLVRQLLVESLVLALVGAGLGLLLALWGVDLLRAARPGLPGSLAGQPMTIDAAVLGYTMAVALGTGLLFGLVPALYASRQDLAQALKDSDHHASAGGKHLRARNLLVVAEVAIAMMLMVAAVLAIRGLARLQAVDPGFELDGLMMSGVTPSPKPEGTPAESIQFWNQIAQNMAAIPGVVSVGWSASAPFVTDQLEAFAPLGVEPTPENMRSAVTYLSSPGFIDTMRIPVLAGRTFGPQDVAGTTPVVVIDKKLADAFFPGEDPVGKRLQDKLSGLPSVEIIGVVGHVLQYEPDGIEKVPYQMYYSFAQLPETSQRQVRLIFMHVIVRFTGAAEDYIEPMQAAVTAVDPRQPLFALGPYKGQVLASFSTRRYTVALLSVFAALALVLAATGLYAVMGNTVAQRTHELGVRMALGAQPRAVVGLVVRHGMVLVGAGVAIGMVGALALTRVLTTLLPASTAALDPTSFLGVALILLVVGLLATYIPARRATRIDPMVALRHE